MCTSAFGGVNCIIALVVISDDDKELVTSLFMLFFLYFCF